MNNFVIILMVLNTGVVQPVITFLKLLETVEPNPFKCVEV